MDFKVTKVYRLLQASELVGSSCMVARLCSLLESRVEEVCTVTGQYHVIDRSFSGPKTCIFCLVCDVYARMFLQLMGYFEKLKLIENN